MEKSPLIKTSHRNRAPTNRFRIDTMGSSEDALYFQTQYNGFAVGYYLCYGYVQINRMEYPCD